jgi:hypothetical protein
MGCEQNPGRGGTKRSVKSSCESDLGKVNRFAAPEMPDLFSFRQNGASLNNIHIQRNIFRFAAASERAIEQSKQALAYALPLLDPPFSNLLNLVCSNVSFSSEAAAVDLLCPKKNGGKIKERATRKEKLLLPKA